MEIVINFSGPKSQTLLSLLTLLITNSGTQVGHAHSLLSLKP
jgi:hypothetical protein